MSDIQAQKIGLTVGLKTTLLKSLPDPTPQALFANLIASTAIYGTFKTTVGYEVGLISSFQFKKVYFKPKINYALNTCDLIQTNYSNMTAYSPLKIRNHVIELHCLLHDNISDKIFIVLGPSIQARINASGGRGTDKFTMKILTKNVIAYGIEGGIGASIAKNIDIQLTNQYSSSIFTTGALTKSGHTATLSLTYWTGYRQIN
ncbi:outer membrane beta-barrel protein [Spirosoma utsteinense]|uniref:Outer membrane protein beta-barrel domain-containing protein n=1 Tax=Spirosoma utsteinense TaxID=2585773 RepID=A0ABR6WEP2_9BACT|nr:outer membrane beta-barrel protein [Spirosoma utsteinense]MBC3794963.1 hypothetical protein [Spirosoma utsteinense]